MPGAKGDNSEGPISSLLLRARPALDSPHYEGPREKKCQRYEESIAIRAVKRVRLAEKLTRRFQQS